MKKYLLGALGALIGMGILKSAYRKGYREGLKTRSEDFTIFACVEETKKKS